MIDQRLQELCPLPLTIVWHKNSSTYLTTHKQKSRLNLRLHRLFQDAPTPVLEALIQFALKRDPEAKAVVRQMAHLYFSQNQIAPEPLPSLGTTYDLKAMYEALNEAHFGGALQATIGWTKPGHNTRFRSLTFGTYDRHKNQIRINRLLDDPAVPAYFVSFIVYHEMIHILCPSYVDAKGRCRIHTPEFREKEKQFPQFQEAMEWEKISLQFFKARKSHGRS